MNFYSTIKSYSHGLCCVFQMRWRPVQSVFPSPNLLATKPTPKWALAWPPFLLTVNTCTPETVSAPTCLSQTPVCPFHLRAQTISTFICFIYTLLGQFQVETETMSAIDSPVCMFQLDICMQKSSLPVLTVATCFA